MTRVELKRISESNLHNKDESNTQFSLLDKSQRLMNDEVKELKKVIENEHRLMHETVQSDRQGFTNEITTIAQAQKEIQIGINALQQANELITEKVLTVTDDMARLDNALHAEDEPVNNRLSEFAINFEGFDKNLNNLYELIQKVSDTIANISEVQITLQETAKNERKEPVSYTHLRAHET